MTSTIRVCVSSGFVTRNEDNHCDNCYEEDDDDDDDDDDEDDDEDDEGDDDDNDNGVWLWSAVNARCIAWNVGIEQNLAPSLGFLACQEWCSFSSRRRYLRQCKRAFYHISILAQTCAHNHNRNL